MPKNESYYTREMSKVLTQAGCMVEAIVGSRMNRPGRPDRYVSSVWWHGWLEAKLEAKKLEPEQEFWHTEALKRQPYSVYIVRFYPRHDMVAIYRQGHTDETIQVPLPYLTKPGVADKKWIHALLDRLNGNEFAKEITG